VGETYVTNNSTLVYRLLFCKGFIPLFMLLCQWTVHLHQVARTIPGLNQCFRSGSELDPGGQK
jgi:hypothetical protein